MWPGIAGYFILMYLYLLTPLKHIELVTLAMLSAIIGGSARALGPFLKDAYASSQEWKSKKKDEEFAKWKIGQPYRKKYEGYGSANVYQVWLEYNKRRVKCIDFLYTVGASVAALAVYTEFLMPASAHQGVSIFGIYLGSESPGALISSVLVIATISLRLAKAIYELWFQPTLEAEAQGEHLPLVSGSAST